MSSRTRKCCGKAVVFYRVRYSELFKHRDNGVREDVFGFCAECASSVGGVQYFRWEKVRGVRGIPELVQAASESECSESGQDKRLHDCKKEFLRIMSTKGRRDVADRWPEIFQMAWDEFRVKAVMGA